MWALLRDRRFCGFKFRRQVPFGPYTLDFFCDELQLAIELDSPAHALHTSRDAIRDRYLELRGTVVLRLLNEEVTADRTPGLAHLETLMRQLYARRSR